MKTLFDAWLVTQPPPQENPMVNKFGKGPDGVVCKDCACFVRRGGYSKTYFKCRLRGITSGPGTDHRAGWQACGQFKGKCSL